MLLKAKKNTVEIHGMQQAHIRDAAAMCEFFAYFDKMVKFAELTPITLMPDLVQGWYHFYRVGCGENCRPVSVRAIAQARE